jgi:hypothetical protein
MRLVLPVCLVAIAGIVLACAQSSWHGISENVGEEAIKRASLLRAGMSEDDVFKTLGLQNFGLKASSSGSGPENAWPTWYMVTEKRSIMIRWDRRRSPPTLVSVQVLPLDRKAHFSN